MDHAPLPDRHVAPLGDRGRVVLPSGLRRLGLRQGDRLIFNPDGQSGFRGVSPREQARRLFDALRDLAPERSLVDELIAERREEARRESEA